MMSGNVHNGGDSTSLSMGKTRGGCGDLQPSPHSHDEFQGFLDPVHRYSTRDLGVAFLSDFAAQGLNPSLCFLERSLGQVTA